MKKRSIALALCCSLVASPVWAKTFVGVLYPLFGPMAAIGLVQLADELKTMPDVEVATYLHQSWKSGRRHQSSTQRYAYPDRRL